MDRKIWRTQEVTTRECAAGMRRGNATNTGKNIAEFNIGLQCCNIEFETAWIIGI